MRPTLRWSARLAAIVLLLHAAQAAAQPAVPAWLRPSPLDQALEVPAARHELAEVIWRVRRMARAGERPVVVFDIDGTLIHRGGRVVDGAERFVNLVKRAGGTVAYVTGRPRMQEAETRAQLATNGFPLEGQVLLMAPRKMGQPEWKAQAKPEVLKHGRVVALMENELPVVRLYRDIYAGSRVFRLRTYSRKPDPHPERGLDGVLVIRGYSKDRAAALRPAALGGLGLGLGQRPLRLLGPHRPRPASGAAAR